jgi:diguanylate cyclase (GGDEF)-like protein
MERHYSAREALRTVAPAIVALAILASVPLWEVWLPLPSPSPVWPLPLLWLLAALAAFYTPLGRWTLSLGTAALPLAIVFFGPSLAGLVAGGAAVLRQVGRRLLLKDPLRRQGVYALLPTVADAGRIVIAVLVAGVVWRLGAGPGPTGVSTLGVWQVLAIAGYLIVLFALRTLDLRAGERLGLPLVRRLSAPLTLDLLGWFLGLIILRIVLTLGWGFGLAVLAAVALLAAEAARNVHLRRQAVERVGELWEVTRAGHRIIHRNPDIGEIAEHVLDECGNVLDVSWYQFEIPKSHDRAKSWWAGPEGKIEEGLATPPDSPPPLPGIHRRTIWKIISRELAVDEDPRQLEPTSLELLDSLLPQVAATVHRSLLERRAKYDALTGLPDRSVLQARLERVFEETRQEGGSMAVIMCDLDHFKKVNDRHGHDVGDQALIKVAEVLETHRRDTDLCCRFGGEEFSVVLEKTDGETAQRVAERLRIEVDRSVFTVDDQRIRLRLSAGIAAYPEIQVKEAHELLLIADEALYMAKRRGRNRSFLNLGQGRYRTADDKVVESEKPAPKIEPPTLFA